MTQQEFLNHKIPILINEGYGKDQAVAIALSMFNKKMQQGGTYGMESMFPISLIEKDKNGNYKIFYKNPEIEPSIYSQEEFELKKNLKQPSSQYPGQYDKHLIEYLNKTNNKIGIELNKQNNPNDIVSTMEHGGDFNLPKFQWAGMFDLDSIIQSQTMSPQQDFSVKNQDYLRNAHTPAQEPKNINQNLLQKKCSIKDLKSIAITKRFN